ncbi:5'-methylthioadenosine/S-adenosylhomocysteine nucleosidase [Buchnera aphidicola (Mindarus abietinus)]
MLNIGIVIAIKKELNEIKKKLFIYKKINLKKYVLYLGSFKKINFFLLQCNIGKTNASCATTLLLQTYKINFIINIGSSGSLKKKIKIFDIIIAKKTCYYDVDLTAFNYPIGKIPNSPNFFNSDSYLKEIAIRACIKKKFSFFLGTLVTGDTFLKEKKKINFIKSIFPSAIALDMEASAIAHVCYIFTIPFINIKFISDCSSKNSQEEFKKNIDLISFKSYLIILEILKNLSDL